ncbi:cytochrome c biogenesis protein transmembrane region [Desulfonatronospira thiodismutans ASO3-1]|uniref:Cytochrome c biogenesis protein transmembrane region n=1 Tax=Desulfonatronospira thiodismutans ASO3-1 TaxID=555779 RepID=D6SLT0_9BACT|nr:cytochrome c biogenesis protein CcdA [Desulfonatronospira thiodismutans]EFI35641.1 cytochrome c biogenesis protein transmembrane region [Desulfonatronospira thiodismutans ASO3-1]
MAVSLGYENVYRDPKGFEAWEEEGYPVHSLPAEAPATPLEAEGPGTLEGLALFGTLAAVFAGGLALNLTPCVYPLIPITVSFFGGMGGQGRGRLLIHGGLYILGLATTNSILGVAAALTGGLIGGLLQNPLVLAGIALVLLIFALSMFGFWELRLPASLNQAASRSFGGYFGSLFMGLTIGVVAAPCIGPFVLGLLAWVATMGSPLLGFAVFFTLSLGLGVPLFFLAVFSGKLQSLPRSGEWMIWVRKLLGWILVGMAVYFLKPLLGDPAGTFVMAAVFLAAALHLGVLDKTQAGFRAFVWMKSAVLLVGMTLAVFIAGSYALQGPGVAWDDYSEALLEQAGEENKPVMLDFYADWCAPCRQLENVTFQDQDVVELSREFITIKVDMTRGGVELHERLVAEYEVRGVPTVIFLTPEGQEMEDLRVVDFIPPGEFLGLMHNALQKTEKE